MCGADWVEPAIFFWRDGCNQGLIKPNCNPMSMMPWTARKLLWNLEPMGSTFGGVCLEAFDRNPADFGRTVMSLLEGATEWVRLWNLGLALC